MALNRLVLLVLVAASCKARERAALLPPDPSMCRPSTVVVELAASERGTYRLNTRPLDSLAIVSYLSTYFKARPDSSRTIVVRADSARSADLPWLLDAIGAAHGRAYSFDAKCSIAIPDSHSKVLGAKQAA